MHPAPASSPEFPGGLPVQRHSNHSSYPNYAQIPEDELQLVVQRQAFQHPLSESHGGSPEDLNGGYGQNQALATGGTWPQYLNKDGTSNPIMIGGHTPYPMPHESRTLPRPSRRTGSRTTLACNECRLRKKKCDGATPCINCRTADVTCEYVESPPSKTELRENKIDELLFLVKKQGKMLARIEEIVGEQRRTQESASKV